jgi:hypothetical protein
MEFNLCQPEEGFLMNRLLVTVTPSQILLPHVLNLKRLKGLQKDSSTPLGSKVASERYTSIHCLHRNTRKLVDDHGVK